MSRVTGSISEIQRVVADFNSYLSTEYEGKVSATARILENRQDVILNLDTEKLILDKYFSMSVAVSFEELAIGRPIIMEILMRMERSMTKKLIKIAMGIDKDA